MASTNLEDNFVVSGEDVNLNTTNTAHHIHDGPSSQSFPVGEPDVLDVRRALLSACRDRDLDFAKELLKTNYFNFTAINYTDAENSNNTALHICAMTNSTAITNMLLKYPMINVNARNDDLDTPLIIASRLGHIKIVVLLLRKSGVNLYIKNRNRRTALTEALNNGHMEIASLLKDHPHGVFDINTQYEATDTAPDGPQEPSGHDAALPTYLHNEDAGTEQPLFSHGSLGAVLPLVDCDNIDPNIQSNRDDAYLVTVSVNEGAEAGLSFALHDTPGVELSTLGFYDIDLITEQGNEDTDIVPTSSNEPSRSSNAEAVNTPCIGDTNGEHPPPSCHTVGPTNQGDSVDADPSPATINGHTDNIDTNLNPITVLDNEDPEPGPVLDTPPSSANTPPGSGNTSPGISPVHETDADTSPVPVPTDKPSDSHRSPVSVSSLNDRAAGGGPSSDTQNGDTNYASSTTPSTLAPKKVGDTDLDTSPTGKTDPASGPTDEHRGNTLSAVSSNGDETKPESLQSTRTVTPSSDEDTQVEPILETMVSSTAVRSDAADTGLATSPINKTGIHTAFAPTGEQGDSESHVTPQTDEIEPSLDTVNTLTAGTSNVTKVNRVTTSNTSQTNDGHDDITTPAMSGQIGSDEADLSPLPNDEQSNNPKSTPTDNRGDIDTTSTVTLVPSPSGGKGTKVESSVGECASISNLPSVSGDVDTLASSTIVPKDASDTDTDTDADTDTDTDNDIDPNTVAQSTSEQANNEPLATSSNEQEPKTEPYTNEWPQINSLLVGSSKNEEIRDEELDPGTGSAVEQSSNAKDDCTFAAAGSQTAACNGPDAISGNTETMAEQPFGLGTSTSDVDITTPSRISYTGNDSTSTADTTGHRETNIQEVDPAATPCDEQGTNTDETLKSTSINRLEDNSATPFTPSSNERTATEPSPGVTTSTHIPSTTEPPSPLISDEVQPASAVPEGQHDKDEGSPALYNGEVTAFEPSLDPAPASSIVHSDLSHTDLAATSNINQRNTSGNNITASPRNGQSHSVDVNPNASSTIEQNTNITANVNCTLPNKPSDNSHKSSVTLPSNEIPMAQLAARRCASSKIESDASDTMLASTSISGLDNTNNYDPEHTSGSDDVDSSSAISSDESDESGEQDSNGKVDCNSPSGGALPRNPEDGAEALRTTPDSGHSYDSGVQSGSEYAQNRDSTTKERLPDGQSIIINPNVETNSTDPDHTNAPILGHRKMGNFDPPIVSGDGEEVEPSLGPAAPLTTVHGNTSRIIPNVPHSADITHPQKDEQNDDICKSPDSPNVEDPMAEPLLEPATTAATVGHGHTDDDDDLAIISEIDQTQTSNPDPTTSSGNINNGKDNFAPSSSYEDIDSQADVVSPHMAPINPSSEREESTTELSVDIIIPPDNGSAGDVKDAYPSKGRNSDKTRAVAPFSNERIQEDNVVRLSGPSDGNTRSVSVEPTFAPTDMQYSIVDVPPIGSSSGEDKPRESVLDLGPTSNGLETGTNLVASQINKAEPSTFGPSQGRQSKNGDESSVLMSNEEPIEPSFDTVAASSTVPSIMDNITTSHVGQSNIGDADSDIISRNRQVDNEELDPSAGSIIEQASDTSPGLTPASRIHSNNSHQSPATLSGVEDIETEPPAERCGTSPNIENSSDSSLATIPITKRNNADSLILSNNDYHSPGDVSSVIALNNEESNINLDTPSSDEDRSIDVADLTANPSNGCLGGRNIDPTITLDLSGGRSTIGDADTNPALCDAHGDDEGIRPIIITDSERKDTDIPDGGLGNVDTIGPILILNNRLETDASPSTALVIGGAKTEECPSLDTVLNAGHGNSGHIQLVTITNNQGSGAAAAPRDTQSMGGNDDILSPSTDAQSSIGSDETLSVSAETEQFDFVTTPSNGHQYTDPTAWNDEHENFNHVDPVNSSSDQHSQSPGDNDDSLSISTDDDVSIYTLAPSTYEGTTAKALFDLNTPPADVQNSTGDTTLSPIPDIGRNFIGNTHNTTSSQNEQINDDGLEATPTSSDEQINTTNSDQSNDHESIPSPLHDEHTSSPASIELGNVPRSITTRNPNYPTTASGSGSPHTPTANLQNSELYHPTVQSPTATSISTARSSDTLISNIFTNTATSSSSNTESPLTPITALPDNDNGRDDHAAKAKPDMISNEIMTALAAAFGQIDGILNAASKATGIPIEEVLNRYLAHASAPAKSDTVVSRDKLTTIYEYLSDGFANHGKPLPSQCISCLWANLIHHCASSGVVIINWPVDVKFPHQAIQASGIPPLEPSEQTAMVDAITSSDPSCKLRLIPGNMQAMKKSDEPVIIGAPPPLNSRIKRAPRLFLDKRIDYLGPASDAGQLPLDEATPEGELRAQRKRSFLRHEPEDEASNEGSPPVTPAPANASSGSPSYTSDSDNGPLTMASPMKPATRKKFFNRRNKKSRVSESGSGSSSDSESVSSNDSESPVISKQQASNDGSTRVANPRAQDAASASSTLARSLSEVRSSTPPLTISAIGSKLWSWSKRS